MLLDARCEDTNLWSSVLADACRYPELCRVLILRVFPRVARSTVADAFARKGSILAPPWEEVSCAFRLPDRSDELRGENIVMRRLRDKSMGNFGLYFTIL